MASAGCGLLSDLRGDVLAVLQRSVDLRSPGDHRRELLGALVADVLELRDPDVLDARQARPLRRPRVVDRRGGHGRQRLVGERGGRLLVLRALVGRLAQISCGGAAIPPGTRWPGCVTYEAQR